MKLLLMNGSPRRKKAHFVFANTTKELAEEGGHEAEVFHAIDFHEGKKDIGDLKKALSGTDIIGLFTPLYVDALPYPVIELLENLGAACREELKGKRLYAISGCGFPDFTLFEPVFGACACFARSMEMTWLGGMGYVATPMQDGQDPDKMGKRGQGIITGLQLALDAVLEGRMVTEEAQREFAMHFPRPLLYLFAPFVNILARRSCRKLGTDLYARPYAD